MKAHFSLWHLLTLLALVLPALYLAYTWPALPARIPTHFDIGGNANGYTDKANIWLTCLGLPVGTYLLLIFLPRFDPKRRLSASNLNYQKLTLAFVALMSGLSIHSLYVAVHAQEKPGQGIAVLVGLFFAFLGNYLTTVQPNYFVGFKTPWALEFPRIWAQVHRVGGRMFFATGLLSALLGILSPVEAATTVLLAGLLATVVVVYSYSYWLYRKEMRAANAG
ncbi:SdpI family protein [Microvirga sp. STR05]|uniref:SdpI family protein n=1 Tax=Hymenobacter duratus TaxID=2771356 RepID=A0ABR8JGL7_9BACT|nr:SdpI family protein [Hymenobacter duratus]MBD2716003.1 SdpI family protein [Hymenobacter duratus]MBR7950917.1 SdpI family protein [Microvirga sp. STR05]